MRKATTTILWVLFASVLVLSAQWVEANERVSTRPADMNKPPGETGDGKKDQKCDQVADSDDRNLCRALTRDEFNSAEQKRDRYRNKDHSAYYCTLVKDRDKQTYCFAVARNLKSMCGNIIDSELEKACNSKLP